MAEIINIQPKTAGNTLSAEEFNEVVSKANSAIGELNQEITERGQADEAFEESLGNPDTGHSHNGVNSRRVDHADLLNKGSNTHAQIDQALINLTSGMQDKFKSVTYSAVNGVLTFTRHDNTTVVIDFPLELIVSSGSYDADTDEIVLILANAQEIRIPITNLITEIQAEIISLQTNKEDKSNKKSVVNNSDTEYPNSQAVRDFVHNEITSEKWNPASMALLYNPDIVVDEKTEIKPFIYPESANQSVVLQIDEGSAKVNPDGLVTAKAVGEVRIFVISTLRSKVWQEAMLTAREAEALELEDGTPVTTEDLTSIEV